MSLRRTIIVHTRLAGHMARVQAARAGESGVQILTMGQLAARLAGGLLRPIDPDDLKIAVRELLASVQLGELEPIKELPGMVRAAAGTLDKVWSAGDRSLPPNASAPGRASQARTGSPAPAARVHETAARPGRARAAPASALRRP